MNSIEDKSFTGWVRLYNLTFIVGLAISFSVFWVLNFFFPPPGLGEETLFVDTKVLDGVCEETSEDGIEKLGRDTEKGVIVATLPA